MSQNLLNQSPSGANPFELGLNYLTQARECKALQDPRQARYLFTEAKEAFKKARSTEPAPALRAYFAQAYMERGDVLRDLGLTEKARASYQKASPYSQEEAAQKLAALPPLPARKFSLKFSLSFSKKPASVTSASVQISPAPAAVV